jgi:hypothetical protein
MYWRSVQLCWLAEKVLMLGAKAVLKIVREFLNSCCNQVQISCPLSPLLGFSHWKTKIVGSVGLGRCRKMCP